MEPAGVTESAERFAKRCLKGEGTGHDWWHIERVRNNARMIHEKESGNWQVIELAVLLHDVGDRKVIHQDEDDYTIAERFLRRHRVGRDDAAQVMHIIQHMSFSSSLGNKKSNESIEFQIVQDADRLDALGAIGIARAFAFGGSRARPLYDPTVTAQSIHTTKSYRALKSSTFHHFEEKLLRLKDLMNTATARRMAAKRHAYMETFLDGFLDEWHGRR